MLLLGRFTAIDVRVVNVINFYFVLVSVNFLIRRLKDWLVLVRIDLRLPQCFPKDIACLILTSCVWHEDVEKSILFFEILKRRNVSSLV